MALQPDKVPTVAIIGLAWVLGSGVLAWMSSPATLNLERDDEHRVTATIEGRLFGLIVTDGDRIEGIRSLRLQQFEDSHTPDRLIFETTRGAVDLGRNQQLFAPDEPEIAAFLQADGPASLTLSSIARGSELRRFVFAQAAALFLFLVGLGLLLAVVRSLYA